MTKNEHIYAIFCRLEVAGDVLSGDNVTTIVGYAVLNFEVASFSNFPDIKEKSIISVVADIEDALNENAFAFRFKALLLLL